MNETALQNAPSERQRKYLGRLLAKAHEYGVPYLPTEQLTRAQVSDWIDYLKRVVGEEPERDALEPAERDRAKRSNSSPPLPPSALAKPLGHCPPSLEYEFGLERQGSIIDTTSLDENDDAHAADLFYTEFGYEPEAGDRILLVAVGQEAPYLRTPARHLAPAGYRPPFQLVPEAFDHEHRLDTYTTDDDHDVVYCTVCGGEW